MSPDAHDKLDAALEHVKSNRRDLLKRLLVGSGTAALLAPVTNVLAAGKSKAKIAKCLDDKLESEGFAGEYNIKAKVSNDGAVVLTGKTEYQNIKSSAADLARQCGATKVTNKITVNGPAKGPKTPHKPKAP